MTLKGIFYHVCDHMLLVVPMAPQALEALTN